eukprot:gene4079-2921_t
MEMHRMLLHERAGDTAKYLDERRKRYPTQARVAEVRRQLAAKRQRGEPAPRTGAAGVAGGGKMVVWQPRPAPPPQGGKDGGKGKGKGKRGRPELPRPPLYYRCRRCGRTGHYSEHCWLEDRPVKGFRRRA